MRCWSIIKRIWVEALLACGDNFFSLTVAEKDLVHVELNGQFLAGVVYVFNRHASDQVAFEVNNDSEPIGSEISTDAVTGMARIAHLCSFEFRRQLLEDDHARAIDRNDVHCLLYSYRAKTGE